MTFQGKPLDRWATPTGNAGYSTLYHWRACARWRGLTWEYFRSLSADDQAGYIAEYETALKLETLEYEAARKAAERKARRSRMHGRSRT